MTKFYFSKVRGMKNFIGPGQSFFCISAESFYFDLDFPRGTLLPFPNLQRPISTKHQHTKGFDCVGRDKNTISDCFHCQLQENFCHHITDNLSPFHPLSVRNPENRDITVHDYSSLPFSCLSKVGLAQFNLPAEEFFRIPAHHGKGHMDCMKGLEGHEISVINLAMNSSYLPGQFKGLVHNHFRQDQCDLFIPCLEKL